MKQLNLSRGEMRVMLSDGVNGEEAFRHLAWKPDSSAGFLAEQVLKNGSKNVDDDATVAAVRLRPTSLAT